MKILFLRNTNIRLTHKDHKIPPIGVIHKATILEVEDQVYHGVLIQDSDIYYKDSNGWYYWGGKVQVLEASKLGPKRVEEAADIEAIEIPSNLDSHKEEPPPKILPEELPSSINPEELDVNDNEQVFETEELDSIIDEIPTASESEQNETPIPKDESENKPSEELKNPASSQKIFTTETAFPKILNPQEEVETKSNLSSSPNLEKKDPEGKISDSHPAQKQTPVLKKPSNSGQHLRIVLITNGLTQKHRTQQVQQQSFGASKMARSSLTEFFVDFLIEENKGKLPKAQLLIAALPPSNPNSPYPAFEAAIQWGIQQNVDLIVNIFAWKKSVFSFEELLSLEKLTKQAENHNILWINACGDDREGRPEARFPARFARVISIGAFDEETKQAFYSVKSHTLDFLVPVDKTVLSRSFCLDPKIRNLFQL